jgi:hypothetical protein
VIINGMAVILFMIGYVFFGVILIRTARLAPLVRGVYWFRDGLLDSSAAWPIRTNRVPGIERAVAE